MSYVDADGRRAKPSRGYPEAYERVHSKSETGVTRKGEWLV